MISKEITNIILNVIFIATFIAIFFFTYGTFVEKSVIKEQVNYAITDLVGNAQFFLTEYQLEMLKQYIGTIQIPDMSQADKQAKQHNKKLIIEASIIMGILLIVGIIISVILSIVYKFSFGKLLILNLVILIFIALTEFMFLTFLGKRYKSLDPNFIKVTILETIQNLDANNPINNT